MDQGLQPQFEAISQLIKQARARSYRLVNQQLVELYWQIGQYLHQKLETTEWGEGVIQKLADYITQHHPGLKGFSRRSLFRMKQFYSTYANDTKVSALRTQLNWTQHRIILSQTHSALEREFYIQKCISESYSTRELERQIKSGLYERTQLAPRSQSPSLRKQTADSPHIFRDPYILEFLDLPENPKEKDLRKAILHNLTRFILEAGRDFSFVGEEYRLQVGMDDFYLDLLFFHRGLKCLVAIELKMEHFRPEHLGQLSFYLEALDRDIRKPHENPSVGIILCKSKDEEVVEYALNRQLSPTLISAYQTQLIDKKLLQQKLHELFLLSDGETQTRKK